MCNPFHTLRQILNMASPMWSRGIDPDGSFHDADEVDAACAERERRHAEEIERLNAALTAQRNAMDVIVAETQKRVEERDSLEETLEQRNNEIAILKEYLEDEREDATQWLREHDIEMKRADDAEADLAHLQYRTGQQIEGLEAALRECQNALQFQQFDGNLIAEIQMLRSQLEETCKERDSYRTMLETSQSLVFAYSREKAGLREKLVDVQDALRLADEAIQSGQACRSEAEFTRWMHDSQMQRPNADLFRMPIYSRRFKKVQE